MIRINLLPIREIKAETGRRQEVVLAGMVLGVTAILLALVFLIQSYRLSSLGSELGELNKEVEALNVKVKGVGEMEQKVAELKGKLKVIDDLNKKKVGPVRVMESLSSATPQRLWVTQFRETTGNLTLEGLAIDHQTIADFLKALGNSPYFKNVDLVETTQSEQEGVALKKFSIRANLLYQPPPAPEQPKTAPEAKAQDPKKEGKKG